MYLFREAMLMVEHSLVMLLRPGCSGGAKLSDLTVFRGLLYLYRDVLFKV